MKHLTADEVEELRAALEAEKDDILEQLAEHGRSTDGDWQGSSGASGEEADPNDAADNIEELATNVSLVEELEGRLKDINAAIERMEKGTYGIDESTGEAIDVERLRANPAARTNI